MERYRSLIIGVVVVAVAAIAIGFIFLGSSAAAYSCTREWEPTATPSPGPDASPRLGYVQDPMGNSHAVTTPQTYTFCPPASGTHLNARGLGPIEPRVFGPQDAVTPMSWIHNLEHGAMVVVYRGDSDGATADGQAAFRDFFNTLPESPICKLDPGQVSPVIARFDEMAWPYAAIVWGRVLPLDTWDPDLVREFYLTETERVDANGVRVAPPEPQCTFPTPSSSPSASAGTSPSPSPSASGSASPSASESASPSPSASPS